MNVNPDEEMKMTYTSVLTKNGKPHISLLFERGKDFCEGNVPDCKISRNQGFSADEVEALQQYLAGNKRMIIEHAKEISDFKHMFSRQK